MKDEFFCVFFKYDILVFFVFFSFFRCDTQISIINTVLIMITSLIQ